MTPHRSNSSVTPFEWQADDPGAHGVSAAALVALKEALAARDTTHLLVIRNDRVISEWYADGHSRTTSHYTASLAKAIVGGLSLGLAIQDGLIGPDDPAHRTVPAWADDPLKRAITVRHLATHSSGLADAEKGGRPHDELTGWQGAFWRHDPDPFTVARDQAPVRFEPGQDFAYSNPGMAMLAWCVTAALKDGSVTDIRALLARRIVQPLGINDDQWQVGYGKTFEVNGLPLVPNWGGGSCSPDAVARIARLLLHRGVWQGNAVLKPETVDLLLTDAGTPAPRRWPTVGPFPRSGLGWYINSDRVWPSAAPDTFAGAGAEHQMLIASPSQNLICVRLGGKLGEGSFWGDAHEHLIAPLFAAMGPRAEAGEGSLPTFS